MRGIAVVLDEELLGALGRLIEDAAHTVSEEEVLRAAFRNWAECRGYLDRVGYDSTASTREGNPCEDTALRIKMAQSQNVPLAPTIVYSPRVLLDRRFDTGR